MVHAAEHCLNIMKRLKSLVNHLDDDLEQNLFHDFSMQLAHQNFRITANGFFDFNYQLLGGMFGSVVTFIILMVQLDEDGSDKDIGIHESIDERKSKSVLCREFNLAC